MPTINSNLLPTIDPGQLVNRLTTDTSLAIRWLVATDPVYFETLNRPLADIAVRQLIMAKTLDTINLRLGHQALFPFVIQPRIVSGTTVDDIPLGWVWDMNISMPKKWENLRLAKIKRVSGQNASGSTLIYDGSVRLVFTANEVGSTTEVSIFQTDYVLDSDLTYQIMPIEIPTSAEETNPIDSGEAETIAGWITFRTLDTTDVDVQDFFDLLAPPTGGTEGSGGEYSSPTVYEVQDSDPGGPSNPSDFDPLALSHGSGLLTLSAWNPIPSLDSDVETWLTAFNYPFDETALLQSGTHPTIIVPKAIFKEFNIVAPASDEPTGDSTGTYYPVWLSAIERLDAQADNLRFYFSTYSVGEPTGTTPIEFAVLDLSRDDTEGKVLPIIQNDHLFPTYPTNAEFYQGFGLGFVVLSRKWGTTSSELDEFFDLFLSVIDVPAKVGFSKTSGRVSSYGISRVPDTIPTAGQSEALFGSRFPDLTPSSDNRYIVELDQGLGTAIDFSTSTGLAVDKRVNVDIEDIGYTGSLAHRIIKLVVNSGGTAHDYDTDILPRLMILLGRAPAFGDYWYDGTRLKFFNGDAWQG